MVTKFDGVFTEIGELETNYNTEYLKNGLSVDNIVENTKTIFINTKHKVVFMGVYIKTKISNQQKITFVVKLEKELRYLEHYNNKPSSWYTLSDAEYSRFIAPDSIIDQKEVYITFANSLRMKYYIDKEKIRVLKGEIYKTKIEYFSKYEVGSLLAIQEFFKNPEYFIKNFYKPVKYIDTFKFVWEGGFPAYHINRNCNKLNKEYENYEIPMDIISKGKDEIIKFRKWFNKNIDLLKKPDIFAMKLHLVFGIITNPANINVPNSGSTNIFNYNLSEIENEIDKILISADNYYQKNEKTKTILLKNAYRAFIYKKKKPITDNVTEYSEEEIFRILEEFDINFKTPLFKLLIEYYKLKLNPELKFIDSLLDQIGFKPCSTCYQ